MLRAAYHSLPEFQVSGMKSVTLLNHLTELSQIIHPFN